ncbi:CDIF630_02480 family spore surface protein [Alkaliphilus transvaalensis]|uniref:CDIF630_02480 family spore surface protein n=1 Tax=Alkaliphilus transvaalensis TaxID=114628 RepID=UPI000A0482FD|nr:DUF3787 domain-containing protein [Alkaliphilus transvaalensis]
MTKNNFKARHMGEPVEKHDTAAWANIEDLKPVSRVPIPSEVQVKNAKEYVDTNQK